MKEVTITERRHTLTRKLREKYTRPQVEVTTDHNALVVQVHDSTILSDVQRLVQDAALTLGFTCGMFVKHVPALMPWHQQTAAVVSPEASTEPDDSDADCRFWVYLEQSGGCDYTIGCGFKLEPLSAETLEEAIAEVEGSSSNKDDEDEDEDEEGYVNTEGLVRARIFDVKAVYEFDVAGYDRKKEEAAKAAKAEKQRKKDEADFERLKKQLGKT
jgi:hypothetical protein